MTVEELSNRILDDGFGLDAVHSNEDPPGKTSDDNALDSVERSDDLIIEEPDSLTHYGVLGMKWGVRKKREYKPKKRDRRYDGESDQDYQNRMAREERERSERAKAKTEKRAAKERAQTQKRMLKSQERIRQMEIKAQQKAKVTEIAERKRQEERADKLAKETEAKRRKEERKAEKEKTKSKPVNVRSLSDKDLKSAIQRLKDEEEYKKKSIQNKPFLKKTAILAAGATGAILIEVGKEVAKQRLKEYGNMKSKEFLKKRGIDLSSESNKGMNPDEFVKMFNKLKSEGKI